MTKSRFFIVLTLFFLFGCNNNQGSQMIKLSDNGGFVQLNIPAAYFQGSLPERSVSSVWVNLSYPDLQPTKDPGLLENGISLLILNISGRKTRAEQLAGSDNISIDAIKINSNQELENKKIIHDRRGNTYENEYIYGLTNQGYIICYQHTPGLRVNVSRRYSQNIELRYVISASLLPRRNDVDDKVVSLVDKFVAK